MDKIFNNVHYHWYLSIHCSRGTRRESIRIAIALMIFIKSNESASTYRRLPTGGAYCHDGLHKDTYTRDITSCPHHMTLSWRVSSYDGCQLPVLSLILYILSDSLHTPPLSHTHPSCSVKASPVLWPPPTALCASAPSPLLSPAWVRVTPEPPEAAAAAPTLGTWQTLISTLYLLSVL